MRYGKRSLPYGTRYVVLLAPRVLVQCHPPICICPVQFSLALADQARGVADTETRIATKYPTSSAPECMAFSFSFSFPRASHRLYGVAVRMEILLLRRSYEEEGNHVPTFGSYHARKYGSSSSSSLTNAQNDYTCIGLWIVGRAVNRQRFAVASSRRQLVPPRCSASGLTGRKMKDIGLGKQPKS